MADDGDSQRPHRTRNSLPPLQFRRRLWPRILSILMEQKPNGSAPPSVVLDGLSLFDPHDITEARPLDAIDEAAPARMRDEAWQESMNSMDW